MDRQASQQPPLLQPLQHQQNQHLSQQQQQQPSHSQRQHNMAQQQHHIPQQQHHTPPQQQQHHRPQQQEERQHQRMVMQKEAAALSHRAASLPPSIRQASPRVSVQSIPNHVQPQQSQQLHRQHPQQLLQQQPNGSGYSIRPSPPQQQQPHQLFLAEQYKQQVAESRKGEVMGAPYLNVTAACPSRYEMLRGPSPSYSNPPVYPSFPLSGMTPSTLQHQWQQQQQQHWQQQQWLQQQWHQQQALQMQQQVGPLYAAAAFAEPMKAATPMLRPTQLLPMRLLGDLRLYVPHREPFLGEGGSVHMYLLGKQVKHSVATDEAEECTRDVLALIEAREVPADSTMPLLIHDGHVVCGGPEVCLRYLAKKLGQYGSDHLKDALQDRLLMDLNTWFNVQQAAIQSILSPDSMAKDAVSDYLKSRRHFYLEAEKLLSFFNNKYACAAQPGVDGSLRAPIVALDASIRGPMATRLQPFFLGEEDSLADYFLFSLIDDDQRIAECLSSSSSSEGNSNGGQKQQLQQQQQQQAGSETSDVDMHYFNETPHLHSLYVALLNLPLIQEALLSSDSQDAAAEATPGTAQAATQGDGGSDDSGGAKDRLAPCVATEASTAASVSDSPMQQLQRQQLLQLQQQQLKQLQQLGLTGSLAQCAEGPQPYLLPSMGASYCLPRTPAGAAALHTTLPGGISAGVIGGPCAFTSGANYVQHMLPPQAAPAAGAPYTGTCAGTSGYWQPLTPGRPPHRQQTIQKADCNPYTAVNNGIGYAQQQQLLQQFQQQSGQKGPSLQHVQQPQPHTSMNPPRGPSPQIAVGGDLGEGAK
ncbi:hypothetical protein, conserved [Eimeria brunetti]|uniref:Uncharacterized protein n=1 Tax=Eimeria brunetti TaxID=51314 RepID=U6LIR0_9EIME|nr:hypothetical protein, conserved [Eimeria brunetti]